MSLPSRSISRWLSKDNAWFYLAFILIVGIGSILRFNYITVDYVHPDEPITTGVVQYLKEPGTWDTNWANIPLPERYQYNQYNFSAFFYATYLFDGLVELGSKIGLIHSDYEPRTAYRFFSGLLSIVFLFQVAVLAYSFGGRIVSLLATAIVMGVPLLVQDAHYARPEPFVTVLFLAVISICWPSGRHSYWKILGSSVIIGILVATKVSMLMIAWMPVVPVLFLHSTLGKDFRKVVILSGAVAFFGIVLGFVIGVPGAVLNPDAFIHGVFYLMDQYSGAHPPHSHLDGGFVADIAIGYFWATMGVGIILGGLLGIAFLVRDRNWEAVVLIIAPTLLFVGYFFQQSVFFERNLSHVVPLFGILSAIGIYRAIALIPFKQSYQKSLVTACIGLGVLIQPLQLSATLVFSDFSGSSRGKGRIVLDSIKSELYGEFEFVPTMFKHDTVSYCADHFNSGGGNLLLGIEAYGDEWSDQFIKSLQQSFEMQLVRSVTSNYENVPISTLHTYNSCYIQFYLVTGIKQ